MIAVTDRWRKLHPRAAVGALAIRGAANPETSAALDERRLGVETALRARFEGADRSALKGHPVLAAYAAYYRRFDKTYHVQAQVESVALKGKAIPRVACLVEAMFMAELEGMLLTAGHDLDRITGQVIVDAAVGSEAYQTMAGRDQALKPDDMYIRDGAGILSSIIYGPDSRTRILPGTTRVLFTVYAVPGIPPETVASHLQLLMENVRVVSPKAEQEWMGVCCADGRVLPGA
jgi:DNA/RNA-binding domain of Phe-tRNA-synthetase-like protein